jgi:hypothetical protein
MGVFNSYFAWVESITTPSLFLIDGAVLITLSCKARSEAAVDQFLEQSTTLNSYGAGCWFCSLIEALGCSFHYLRG